MGWELAVTFAFVGSAFVIAYIGNSIKDDENEVSWMRFVPFGLRSFFYFISFGLLLFGMGVQTPILIENGIMIDASMNTTEILEENITGAITISTKLFYVSIFLMMIMAFLVIIQSVLLNRKAKMGRDPYDEEK